MKKLFLLIPFLSFLFLISCNNKNKKQYEALQQRNDSLNVVNSKSSEDLDSMLSLLNEVESNFQSLNSAEDYLTVKSSSNESFTPSMKERIQKDMQLITQTLSRNRQKIALLEKKLRRSSFNSVQLRKALDNMRTELSSKTNMLVNFQKQLSQKDKQIEELSESVSSLSADVQNLRTESSSQKETIERQNVELSTVYYCFGTSKELKDQKILVRGQLGTNFNVDYFIRVKNFRDLKTIPLYSRKAKLLTKHPLGSYSFIKDLNKNLTLVISSPDTFWSLSKFLVVQVY